MRTVEVFRASLLRRQWAFRFVADNGEIVAQSETYRRRIDAVTTAALVAKGFTEAELSIEPPITEAELEQARAVWEGTR